jgi:CDP-diacylglycerol--glycerol-3-phosphate 3-phosphatidyltransferase/cardiolipin synthase
MSTTFSASGEHLDESHGRDRLATIVVSFIVGIRFVAAPLFLITFASDLRAWALCIFLVAVLSDAVDGRVGRRLGGASPLLGAYSDPMADFALVLAAFMAFVLKDLYPGWLLLLIVAMFAQFVLTSRPAGPIYDPVGKYYGAFLFGAAGLTALLPSAGIRQVLLVLVLGFTVASAISRVLFLLGPLMQREPDQDSLDPLREQGVAPGKHGRGETRGGAHARSLERGAGLLTLGHSQGLDPDQKA